MRGVELRTKFAGKMYLSANRGDKVAVDLKDALTQAGYPVHDDLLVFGNQIMFQVRTPITTTAEQGIAEMDKSQTPPGRDGGEQFPPGPKVSKKDIKAMQKDPAKHLNDLFAKEYAKKKMKEQGVAEDTPVPTAMGAATSQATAPAQSQAQSAALATAQQQQQKREMQDEIKNKQAEISQLQKSMVSV